MIDRYEIEISDELAEAVHEIHDDVVTRKYRSGRSRSRKPANVSEMTDDPLPRKLTRLVNEAYISELREIRQRRDGSSGLTYWNPDED